MMKKRIIAVLLFLAHWITAQTSSENYIKTKIYLDSVKTSQDITRQIETVEYYDGLGRPKQIINVKSTPLSNDVVTPVEYDAYGRQTKTYLPLPMWSTNDGAYYSGLAIGSAAYESGEKLYAEKVLEASPLTGSSNKRIRGMHGQKNPLLSDMT